MDHIDGRVDVMTHNPEGQGSMSEETPMGNGACAAAKESLASGLLGDFPAGISPAVLRHIEQCPACSRELEARTRIAAGLKRAVQHEPASPYLEARIRRAIRELDAPPRTRWRWGRELAAVTAAVVVCFGVWIAYELGHLRVTTAAQESYIASISAKVASILRVGLGDHVHCAVFRKFPKSPPAVAEMITKLGPDYSGLLPVIQAGVPEQYRIFLAHRCSYRGRKFVHFALKGDSKLLSLVITERGDGESFGRDGLSPVLAESGISIFKGGIQRFAIAGFQSDSHLVYLVSDLGESSNLDILASLASPVRAFLVGMSG